MTFLKTFEIPAGNITIYEDVRYSENKVYDIHFFSKDESRGVSFINMDKDDLIGIKKVIDDVLNEEMTKE